MSELTECLANIGNSLFNLPRMWNREEAEDIVVGLLLMYGNFRNELQEDTNISPLLLFEHKNRSLNHCNGGTYACRAAYRMRRKGWLCVSRLWNL